MESADHNFTGRQDEVVSSILGWWDAAQKGAIRNPIWVPPALAPAETETAVASVKESDDAAAAAAAATASPITASAKVESSRL